MQCKREIEEIIKKDEDSIYVYKFENKLNYEKEIIDMEKHLIFQFPYNSMFF